MIVDDRPISADLTRSAFAELAANGVDSVATTWSASRWSSVVVDLVVERAEHARDTSLLGNRREARERVDVEAEVPRDRLYRCTAR